MLIIPKSWSLDLRTTQYCCCWYRTPRPTMLNIVHSSISAQSKNQLRLATTFTVFWALFWRRKLRFLAWKTVFLIDRLVSSLTCYSCNDNQDTKINRTQTKRVQRERRSGFEMMKSSINIAVITAANSDGKRLKNGMKVMTYIATSS